MFTLKSETPLPAAVPTRYAGMAYDGDCFYFTERGARKVYQYGRSFVPERSFHTARSYASLCFDPSERCFWAASSQCAAEIFKLDACFREIDCYAVAVPGCGEPGLVTGLSYDCSRDRLVVAFASMVVCVEKDRRVSRPLVRCGGEWILGLVSVSPYIFVNCADDDRQTIRIFSSEGALLEEYTLPGADVVIAAVFNPSPDPGEPLRFLALASRRGGSSYVLDCALPRETLEQAVSPCNLWPCRPPQEEPGEWSSARILDSMAALQKAVSYILSAEAEKLREADDPADILEAGESVQETLVRAAQLEYVVYDILHELEFPSHP